MRIVMNQCGDHATTPLCRLLAASLLGCHEPELRGSCEGAATSLCILINGRCVNGGAEKGFNAGLDTGLVGLGLTNPLQSRVLNAAADLDTT